MKVTFKPAGDRVLIKSDDAMEKKGSILIPDVAKEKPQSATVVAVGPGKQMEDGQYLKPPFKVGDKILASKFGGTEVKIDGEDYRLVNTEDILGLF